MPEIVLKRSPIGGSDLFPHESPQITPQKYAKDLWILIRTNWRAKNIQAVSNKNPNKNQEENQIVGVLKALLSNKWNFPCNYEQLKKKISKTAELER